MLTHSSGLQYVKCYTKNSLNIPLLQINDLTVICCFLKCTYFYGDTLKLTQFFCLISSSDQISLLCTSSLIKGHIFSIHISIQGIICDTPFQDQLIPFPCLLVAKYVLRVPCLFYAVEGEVNLFDYCNDIYILHLQNQSRYDCLYS